MSFKLKFSSVEREKIVENCSKCLWTNEGEDGLDYLVKKRQLNPDALKELKVGYMPIHVGHQLRGRVIFPLFDPSGNLISISSRSINGLHKGEMPVYWHESYEKSYYLYGIHVAKSYIESCGYAVVCEGQIDLLQMFSNGIKNVVALCSNKMSDIQMSVLLRYCEDIVVVLDVDDNQSGQKASSKIQNKVDSVYGKIVSNSKPFNWDIGKSIAKRRVCCVTIPQKCDPDEYIRLYGVDPLIKIINKKLLEMRSSYGYY